MRKLKVGIVGGGIGGVALAGALSKFGVEWRLFERAPSFGDVGAGIQMTPNAVKVIRALGLWEPLREASFLPHNLMGRDWKTGAVNFCTPLIEECPRLYGAEYFHVHRADLHSILMSLIAPGQTRQAASCVEVRQTGSSAVAKFSDGSEFEADAIVGADGLHSAVRASVFGEAAPRFTGNMCWRAVIPCESEQLSFVSPDASFWLGPNGHVVTYYVRRGRAVNLVAIRETGAWVEESWNVASSREEMMAGFPDWHPNLQQLFSRAEAVFKWGLFDRDPMPAWSSGRITLLGDAAHPMLPFLSQGAAMAIEDAYVLARVLARSNNVIDALKEYERLRLPRTSRVQLESRKRGQTYHVQSGWKKFSRNALYRMRQLINPHKGGVQAGWVYAYDATA